MNHISSSEGSIFKNPEHKPLEKLKLTVQIDGIKHTIPALDEHWVEKRTFLIYEPPQLVDSDRKDIIGAKERWLEVANFMLDDFNWLLQLPFYKFWSNVVYNPGIMNSITSFLQEAPTFYTIENFPNDYDIRNLFKGIRRVVLVIFARLVTHKESSDEYLTLSMHAELLYDKYIFSIPILMDLCQQYGRDNKKTVEKIVNNVFTVQHMYQKDLEKANAYVIEALQNIERRFEDCPYDKDGKAVPLAERSGNMEITLVSLEDIILYLLDIVSTVNIFIEIYPPVVNNFKNETFLSRLVSVYNSTIPEMYKKLDELALKDETIEKYTQLKELIDVIRIEILNVYRIITYKNIKNIKESGSSHSEVGEIVDDFLNCLMQTLSGKEFITDYNNIYPIVDDFEILSSIYPDIDLIKYNFITETISSFLIESMSPTVNKIKSNKISEPVAGCSSIQNNKVLEIKDDNVAGSSNTKTKSELELTFLISEVKSILCDLGEGFIQKCLTHYNNKPESVINAVLEDCLPPELQCLDRTLPFIPPDSDETSAAVDAAIGVQRLNIYDNDEFDIMTKDVIDTSRVHKGKRKDKYKNLNDLLNDKSHIAKTKDIYNKYSVVTSEYDDEYDDTYDDQDIGPSAQDDVEVDARPFTIPRVLRKQEVNDYYEDDDEQNDVDHSSGFQAKRDNFVEDPAVLRAKAEERRLNKHGTRTFTAQNKNVIGNPKGQGQSKEVTDNRNQKNKNKSAKANHNRRAGSQWKRNHGMVPS